MSATGLRRSRLTFHAEAGLRMKARSPSRAIWTAVSTGVPLWRNVVRTTGLQSSNAANPSDRVSRTDMRAVLQFPYLATGLAARDSYVKMTVDPFARS